METAKQDIVKDTERPVVKQVLQKKEEPAFTEVITEPTVYQVMRRRSVKNVVMIDGVPVETEEVVEEPDEQIVTRSFFTDPNSSSTVVRAIRRRIVKTITMVNGKPVEKEEVIEEPEDVTEDLTESDRKFLDSVYEPGTSTQVTSSSPERVRYLVSPETKFLDSAEEVQEPDTTVVSQQDIRRVVKRTLMADGKPVEIEELEDPMKYQKEGLQKSQPSQIQLKTEVKQDAQPTELEKMSRVTRKRIIKKIVIVDGKPVETQEIVDEPEGTFDELMQSLPSESSVTEVIYEPEVTTRKIIRKRIIKKIVMVDGKPVEKEEVVEEPEDVTEEMIQNLSPESIMTETTCEPEIITTRRVIRKRIVKKITMVDGKPVETEEIVEEPEDVTDEIFGRQLSETETVCEPEINTTGKIIRKRIIKKVVMVDGKPVETEEVVEEPEDVTDEMLQNLPSSSVITETVSEPDITTTRRIIRKRIIKKIVIVDGKPVETEEVVEEPEEVTDTMLQNVPSESVITETISEPEITTTMTRRIIRKRIIKKIIIVDGKPVETEEVVEEPEEVTDDMMPGIPSESVVTEIVSEPETTTTTRRIIRKRIIKKIIMVDGKPVETEEVVEEPEEVTDDMMPDIPSESLVTEVVSEPEITTTTMRRIIRKRIIKKIVMIDGKPVETEEVVEEPEEVTDGTLQNLPSDSVITEMISEPEVATTTRIIRKRVVKKIIMVNGKPVETEEVVEEPGEVTDTMLQNVPSESVVTEIVSEPETTTTTRRIIKKRIIKKIIIVDGKPVETEEVVEEPEEVTDDMLQNLPSDSVITETVSEPEITTTMRRIIRKRIIKKIIIVDGKPVETEEVVEEPEEVTDMLQNIPSESVITETISEPEITTTTMRRISRKRIIKKIVIVDGKPVETEEVVEEPEEVTDDMMPDIPSESIVTEIMSEPEITTSTTRRIIRKRIIKKIIMVDGKPVETEEVVEEPEDVTDEMLQNLPSSSVITETVSEPEITTTRRIIRKRIIKKIVIVDGKPVETEEVVEEPEEVTDTMLQNVPSESVITETISEPEIMTTMTKRIIRKRIIKKIIIVDGKPVETEEVVEEPEEVTDDMMSDIPSESVVTETISEPETTTTTRRIIRKRIIKKIIMVDGRPVETEEVVEEPEEVTDGTLQNLPSDSVITETAFEPEVTTMTQRVVRKRIIKKIIIVDGKPVETEEIVEEPDEAAKETSQNIPSESEIMEIVCEPGMDTARKIIRKRIIKRIVIIDGKPVETEEEIEEPEDVTSEMVDSMPLDSRTTEVVTGKRIVVDDGMPVKTEVVSEPKEETVPLSPTGLTLSKALYKPEIKTEVIQKKTIQKIDVSDGGPVETEVGVNKEYLENIPASDVVTETVSEPDITTTRVIRRKVIKKIIMVDGKPTETEEVIEEPDSEVTSEVGQLSTATSGGIRIIKKNIKIRRIVRIVDGKEVVEEERSESPDEVLEYPQADETTEEITLPISHEVENIEWERDGVTGEITSQPARVVRKIKIVDGKPVVSKEILEGDEYIDGSVTTETKTVQVHAVRRRMKIVKRVQIINGERVETEEVVEEPETHFGMPDDKYDDTVTDIYDQERMEEPVSKDDIIANFPAPISDVQEVPRKPGDSKLKWKENLYASKPVDAKETATIPYETVDIAKDIPASPPSQFESTPAPFPMPESSVPQPVRKDDSKPEEIEDEDMSVNVWTKGLYNKVVSETSKRNEIPTAVDKAPSLTIQEVQVKERELEPFPDLSKTSEDTSQDVPVSKKKEEDVHSVIVTQEQQTVEMQRTKELYPQAFPSPRELSIKDEDRLPLHHEDVTTSSDPFPVPKTKDSGNNQLHKFGETPGVFKSAVYKKTAAQEKTEKIDDTREPTDLSSLPVLPSKESDMIVEFPAPVGGFPQPDKSSGKQEPKDSEGQFVVFKDKEYSPALELRDPEAIRGTSSMAPPVPPVISDISYETSKSFPPFAQPQEFSERSAFPEVSQEDNSSLVHDSTLTTVVTWKESHYEQHEHEKIKSISNEDNQAPWSPPEEKLSPKEDKLEHFPIPLNDIPQPLAAEEEPKDADDKTTRTWPDSQYSKVVSTEAPGTIPQSKDTPMSPPLSPTTKPEALDVSRFPTPGVPAKEDIATSPKIAPEKVENVLYVNEPKSLDSKTPSDLHEKGMTPPEYITEPANDIPIEPFPAPASPPTQVLPADGVPSLQWPKETYTKNEMPAHDLGSPREGTVINLPELPMKRPDEIPDDKDFPVPVACFPTPISDAKEPQKVVTVNVYSVDVYSKDKTSEEPTPIVVQEDLKQPPVTVPEYDTEKDESPSAPFPEIAPGTQETHELVSKDGVVVKEIEDKLSSEPFPQPVSSPTQVMPISGQIPLQWNVEKYEQNTVQVSSEGHPEVAPIHLPELPAKIPDEMGKQEGFPSPVGDFPQPVCDDQEPEKTEITPVFTDVVYRKSEITEKTLPIVEQEDLKQQPVVAPAYEVKEEAEVASFPEVLLGVQDEETILAAKEQDKPSTASKPEEEADLSETKDIDSMKPFPIPLSPVTPTTIDDGEAPLKWKVEKYEQIEVQLQDTEIPDGGGDIHLPDLPAERPKDVATVEDFPVPVVGFPKPSHSNDEPESVENLRVFTDVVYDKNATEETHSIVEQEDLRQPPAQVPAYEVKEEISDTPFPVIVSATLKDPVALDTTIEKKSEILLTSPEDKVVHDKTKEEDASVICSEPELVFSVPESTEVEVKPFPEPQSSTDEVMPSDGQTPLQWTLERYEQNRMKSHGEALLETGDEIHLPDLPTKMPDELTDDKEFPLPVGSFPTPTSNNQEPNEVKTPNLFKEDVYGKEKVVGETGPIIEQEDLKQPLLTVPEIPQRRPDEIIDDKDFPIPVDSFPVPTSDGDEPKEVEVSNVFKENVYIKEKVTLETYPITEQEDLKLPLLTTVELPTKIPDEPVKDKDFPVPVDSFPSPTGENQEPRDINTSSIFTDVVYKKEKVITQYKPITEQENLKQPPVTAPQYEIEEQISVAAFPGIGPASDKEAMNAKIAVEEAVKLPDQKEKVVDQVIENFPEPKQTDDDLPTDVTSAGIWKDEKYKKIEDDNKDLEITVDVKSAPLSPLPMKVPDEPAKEADFPSPVADVPQPSATEESYPESTKSPEIFKETVYTSVEVKDEILPITEQDDLKQVSPALPVYEVPSTTVEEQFPVISSETSVSEIHEQEKVIPGQVSVSDKELEDEKPLDFPAVDTNQQKTLPTDPVIIIPWQEETYAKKEGSLVADDIPEDKSVPMSPPAPVKEPGEPKQDVTFPTPVGDVPEPSGESEEPLPSVKEGKMFDKDIYDQNQQKPTGFIMEVVGDLSIPVSAPEYQDTKVEDVTPFPVVCKPELDTVSEDGGKVLFKDKTKVEERPDDVSTEMDKVPLHYEELPPETSVHTEAPKEISKESVISTVQPEKVTRPDEVTREMKEVSRITSTELIEEPCEIIEGIMTVPFVATKEVIEMPDDKVKTEVKLTRSDSSRKVPKEPSEVSAEIEASETDHVKVICEPGKPDDANVKVVSTTKQQTPMETVVTEVLHEPETTTTIRKIIRKRIIKKIIYVDGQPVETEEEIEEPEEVTESADVVEEGSTDVVLPSESTVTEVVYEPVTTTTVRRVIRKRIIKKIVYIDGQPVETEEEIEEPEEVSESVDVAEPVTDIPIESTAKEVMYEPYTTTTTEKIIRKRIIKKIIYIDGQPVETEEELEDPEEIIEGVDALEPSTKAKYPPTESAVTEEVCKPTTTATVKRKIKKIVYINGKPVETEEEIEEPEEIGSIEVGDSDTQGDNLPDSSVIKVVAVEGIEEPGRLTSVDVGEQKPSEVSLPDFSVTEIVSEPETITTVRRVIRRRIIKKIVYIDGKPVETEEEIEEPEEVMESVDVGEPHAEIVSLPESDITEVISEPETTTSVRIMKRRIIKKIVYIDGKPVETTEEIEEPEEVTEDVVIAKPGDRESPLVSGAMEVTYEPEAMTTVQRIPKKRIIKKIVYIDGKPVEREEEVEEPEEVTESSSVVEPSTDEDKPLESAITEIVYEPTTTTTVQRVIRKRIIKKIVYIDGKPVETEEEIEEPEEVTESTSVVEPSTVEDEPLESAITEIVYEPTTTTTVKRVIRKRIIKKIVYIDGKPVETEEEVEEPEEVTESTSVVEPSTVEDEPLESAVTEIVYEPTTTTTVKRVIRKRIIKKIVYIDGKPVETEEEIEEPEEVFESADVKPITVEVSSPESTTAEVVYEPEIANVRRVYRKRIIKKIIYIDGHPVETEEEVEEPVEMIEEDAAKLKDLEEPLSPDRVYTDKNELEGTLPAGIMRRIVYIDGKPVETEEEIEEPKEVTAKKKVKPKKKKKQELPSSTEHIQPTILPKDTLESVTEDQPSEIKKVVRDSKDTADDSVPGKDITKETLPLDTSLKEEEPESSGITRFVKRMIKKIVYINGQPVETEEEKEGPEEIIDDSTTVLSPSETVHTENIHQPETSTTIQEAVEEKADITDDKPLKAEGKVEEPAVVESHIIEPGDKEVVCDLPQRTTVEEVAVLPLKPSETKDVIEAVEHGSLTPICTEEPPKPKIEEESSQKESIKLVEEKEKEVEISHVGTVGGSVKTVTEDLSKTPEKARKDTEEPQKPHIETVVAMKPDKQVGPEIHSTVVITTDDSKPRKVNASEESTDMEKDRDKFDKGNKFSPMRVLEKTNNIEAVPLDVGVSDKRVPKETVRTEKVVSEVIPGEMATETVIDKDRITDSRPKEGERLIEDKKDSAPIEQLESKVLDEAVKPAEFTTSTVKVSDKVEKENEPRGRKEIEEKEDVIPVKPTVSETGSKATETVTLIPEVVCEAVIDEKSLDMKEVVEDKEDVIPEVQIVSEVLKVSGKPTVAVTPIQEVVDKVVINDKPMNVREFVVDSDIHEDVPSPACDLVSKAYPILPDGAPTNLDSVKKPDTNGKSTHKDVLEEEPEFVTDKTIVDDVIKEKVVREDDGKAVEDEEVVEKSDGISISKDSNVAGNLKVDSISVPEFSSSDPKLIVEHLPQPAKDSLTDSGVTEKEDIGKHLPSDKVKSQETAKENLREAPSVEGKPTDSLQEPIEMYLPSDIVEEIGESPKVLEVKHEPVIEKDIDEKSLLVKYDDKSDHEKVSTQPKILHEEIEPLPVPTKMDVPLLKTTVDADSSPRRDDSEKVEVLTVLETKEPKSFDKIVTQHVSEEKLLGRQSPEEVSFSPRDNIVVEVSPTDQLDESVPLVSQVVHSAEGEVTKALVSGPDRQVSVETKETVVDENEPEESLRKNIVSPYTTYLNDQFVTNVDIEPLPTVEEVQPKKDIPHITDKIIDEHTAGPPEAVSYDKPQLPQELVSPEVKSALPVTSRSETAIEKQMAPKDQEEVQKLEITEEWDIITSLIKRRQNRKEKQSASSLGAPLIIASAKEPSSQERGGRLDGNLDVLRDAIEKKDVVVVQKVIITIIETISTWLETIEYRTHNIKYAENPIERQQQFEHLRTEILIVEEKISLLEEITEYAHELLTEETIMIIRETMTSLHEQVSQAEKLRQSQQEEVVQLDEKKAQYLAAVGDAEKKISELRSELVKIQETSMSPEEKVAKLETVLAANEETRDYLSHLLLGSHELTHVPEEHVSDELGTVQTELCNIQDSVEKELDRVLRVSTTTTEYEETLMELTHLIEMAETILEARIVARDLDHLTDTITKHKKLFLSLRQCQKVLESLDTALEPNSRVHYQQLYTRSYLRASVLLDKATQRNHQLSLLRAEWVRLLSQLKEEEAWTITATEQATQLHAVSADTYEDNTNSCKVRTIHLVLFCFR